MKHFTPRQLALFLIPSIIGIILFMVPVYVNESWTIIIKIVADAIGINLEAFLPLLCALIITISGIMSMIGAFLRPNFILNNKVLSNSFHCTPVWAIIRFIGAIFIWIAFFELGEEGDLLFLISGPDTGGFVLGSLLTVLVIIFFFAGLLLPLLLDFGLLEFIGALLTKVMRPLFKIPGRAAVDCVTSWVGDGTLGVMLTCNQYESGYYSSREASIISTTFSAVSITFSIVVLAQVGMLDYFGPYYLLICLIGVVCAFIIPRIPPLSLKKDEYLVPGKAAPETLPEGYTGSVDFGLALAAQRVSEHKGIGQFIENGLKNACGMWFGVLPVVMCIGTFALILSTYTPIFEWLGMPFMPLLDLLQVPEAELVSKTMVVGFTDMFTPSVIAASSITNPMSLFLVAVISVTQLIYLSEVGGLVLGSKIPVGLGELFILFLERTVISLLIAAPIAHLLFM